jgi:hypothetical protein
METTMNAKYGADVTEIGCKRVQVGTETLPDGTVQPIFEIQPYVPEAYRRLIEIVTNDGHYGTER